MPPARRERVRRSARLKSNAPLDSRAMDDASTSRGPPKESSGPQLAIQWQSDRTLTDTLVNYLTTQAADCRVLFYSDGKKAMAAVDDHPSGSDKGQIYQNIAKLLFAGHPKYGAAYTINPKKFRNAVGNRIGRGKYKKLKATFSSTGAGVMPAEGTQAKNLLALSELPWYTELDAIWHSNPSMAAVTHSSKPGVDHAGALYSLVQSRGGAGPPTHFGNTSQWSPHAPTYPSPSSTAPSHYGQAYSPGPHIPHYTNTIETPHAGSSQFAPAPALTSAPAPLTPAPALTSAPAPLTPTYYSDLSPYNTRERTCIISRMIRASGPWAHDKNILDYDGWAGRQIIPDGGGWAHAGNI
ncbi:uncharacterized protein HD556DRAFT_1444237 [Suillus plorans]|uniref:Uncharacterized protein n=1 Tax=Suillus plorans TaxID=116603 RepID=A0A9P7APR9_9AGAM|nr:uncharacterized protein HD556DRAFT_1444237 [Suillus plorans]KAG1792843.1 hypothetical protein HD556DRAFT_1444237 [Suillus plorans]